MIAGRLLSGAASGSLVSMNSDSMLVCFSRLWMKHFQESNATLQGYSEKGVFVTCKRGAENKVYCADLIVLHMISRSVAYVLV